MEMSLSGGLRKVQISTCFELAEKLLMIPTAKCYVFILCVLKCADGLGRGRKGGGVGLGGGGGQHGIACKQDQMLNITY